MVEILGNLGDFIGGIAVVVTIAYLAIQIRKNTQANKRAAFQDLTNHQAQIVGMFINDEQLTDLITQSRALGMSDLSDSERMRVGSFYNTAFRHYENAFHQYRDGNISLSQFKQAAEPMAYNLTFKGPREHWNATKSAYSKEFQEFVRSEIEVELVKLGDSP